MQKMPQEVWGLKRATGRWWKEREAGQRAAKGGALMKAESGLQTPHGSPPIFLDECSLSERKDQVSQS